jgi:hypothetical protein
MESKNSPELNILAAHLAKPFLLPGQSGQPLSLRSLPDGGMVVIAVDGRKLWFTPLEVCRARKELNQPAAKKAVRNTQSNVAALHEPDPRKRRMDARPIGKNRDGMSEMIVLPESLKHLEERTHDQSRTPQKPRSSAAG